MKILQVISSLNAEGGGPVEGLIQQGRQLVANGHRVDVLTLDAPGISLDPRIASSLVFCVGPTQLGTYAFAVRLEPWLRTYASNYDVIVIHGLWQYHGFCTASVCRNLGIPYVIFLHGMLDPWFARQFPLKHLKKWLYWPWAEYRTLRDARFVLFTAAEELALARDSFWLYKARERLVGYGIEAREIPPGQAAEVFLGQFPHLRNTRNLLYLSRIHPKKGCDLLIDAFADLAKSHPELHLIMAGPDQEGWAATLERKAQDAGLAGRITFTGMLKGAMKWGAYDAADVFVLPSHQENFGIVLAEALASGLPVLTTTKVNIWREIEAEHAGLIGEDTRQGIDSLLGRWMTMSELEKATMRRRAAQCFADHFEIGKVTSKLLSALQEAASGERMEHTFKWTQGKLQG